MRNVLVLALLRFQDAEDDENGEDDADDADRVDHDSRDEDRQDEAVDPSKLDLPRCAHLLASFDDLSCNQGRLLLQLCEVASLWQQGQAVLLHLHKSIAAVTSLRVDAHFEVVQHRTRRVHGSKRTALELAEHGLAIVEIRHRALFILEHVCQLVADRLMFGRKLIDSRVVGREELVVVLLRLGGLVREDVDLLAQALSADPGRVCIAPSVDHVHKRRALADAVLHGGEHGADEVERPDRNGEVTDSEDQVPDAWPHLLSFPIVGARIVLLAG